MCVDIRSLHEMLSADAQHTIPQQLIVTAHDLQRYWILCHSSGFWSRCEFEGFLWELALKTSQGWISVTHHGNVWVNDCTADGQQLHSIRIIHFIGYWLAFHCTFTWGWECFSMLLEVENAFPRNQWSHCRNIKTMASMINLKEGFSSNTDVGWVLQCNLTRIECNICYVLSNVIYD